MSVQDDRGGSSTHQMARFPHFFAIFRATAGVAGCSQSVRSAMNKEKAAGTMNTAGYRQDSTLKTAKKCAMNAI